MDKRQQRTLAKQEDIRQAALELFSYHGVAGVSMDEIAAQANVSKVSIYKYFGSKENLHTDVVNTLVERMLVETKAVFDSDLDFLEKLRYALLTKIRSSQSVRWSYLLRIWEQNDQLGDSIHQRLQHRVKALMYQLFEEGKRQGYIDEALPFDLLYLYSEILRAGMRAKAVDLESVLVDKDMVEKLVNIHFFGFIKR